MELAEEDKPTDLTGLSTTTDFPSSRAMCAFSTASHEVKNSKTFYSYEFKKLTKYLTNVNFGDFIL